ncbi:DUF6359 domain-containing protein [Lysinibacillus telephonicus]|uniref:DUF6359 domain-containing protein n=1 Tax=Lysinibacillus telephonicus TaxID=1714840 RepID=UPI0031FC2CF5
MNKRKFKKSMNAFLVASLVATVVVPATPAIINAESASKDLNKYTFKNYSNRVIAATETTTPDTTTIVQEFITVEEAIANNSGIATVRGYIVGIANSGSKYDQEPPFTVNTNIGLADDPNETDPSKILPVQLPSGAIRSDLNLVDNPENFKKEIMITGSLEAYFSVPGLKSPTEYSIVGQDPAPEEPVQIISIAEARTQGEGKVSVNGTVTAILKNTIHIQDETGAIAIYPTSLNVQVGDEIVVIGTLSEYNDLLQLQSPKLVENKGQVGVPEAVVLNGSELVEENESKLATINNVTLKSVNEGTGWANYLASDGTEFIVRDETGSLGLSVGSIYESITGIVQEFNGNFQIIPRSKADIVEDSSKVQIVAASHQSGVIPAGTEVTLSTSTEGAEIYYTTDGSDPLTNGQLYSEPIVVNEAMTMKAIAKKEGLTASQVSEFSYTVYNQEDGLQIHHIQSESHNSPFDGKIVENIEGIVTYTYKIGNGNYFHIQTPDHLIDNNPKTSEGIVVYTGNQALVEIGDLVSVTGTVDEYHIDGYNDTKQDTDLSVTQINARNDRNGIVRVLEKGVELPEPIKITSDNLPNAVIDNDGFADFDPEEDAIDFWESLEGMLVEVGTVKAVAPQEHGDLITVLEERATNTINGGVLLEENNANPDRIQFKLFDNYEARDFEVATGDKFTGPIQGVVNYGFQNYKIYADYEYMKAKHVEGSAEPEKTTIVKTEDKLTIASYNLENFSNNTNETTEDKAAKLARAIGTDMGSPDIVGVTEVQDNNGQGAGDAAANESYERLIDAIEKESGVRYEYLNIDPINNEDGGAPNANIRVGFLYNPDRVSIPEGITPGDATTSVGYVDGKLTHNPGRIDPTNEAFEDSRKPLAAQFVFQGKEVIVIANHWNSKSGDTPLFGSTQPPVYGSEEQRHKIANVVYDFVEKIKNDNPDANIVSLGDFNDFQFSESLKIHEGELMTNMINHVEESDRYTYLFQGNSQVLDHILVSNNLVDNTEIDILHINADFTDMAGRASDHDPVMVQIDLHAEDSEEPIVAEKIYNLTNYKTGKLIINKPSVSVTLDHNSEIKNGIVFTGKYAEFAGEGLANVMLTVKPKQPGAIIDLKNTKVGRIIIDGPNVAEIRNAHEEQIFEYINGAGPGTNPGDDPNTTPDSASIKLSVLSDIHYYDTSLGTSGEALNAYLENDRKLLIESAAVLHSAVEEIKENDSEVVLISGDLTKDGELVGHQNVVKVLKELEAAGKKVYVTHGNHDIQNPHAVKFVGDATEQVPSVSVEQYKELYNDFGYGEAIAQDSNSLSYVVQPKDGIRIIVMDSVLYNTNMVDGKPKTSGAIDQQRLTWILEQIEDAKENNQLIIGMTHHGIVEHFEVQEEIFPQYVIEDWQKVSETLANAGLNIVFTGHFHAQDAVSKTTAAGNTIYDIETGSLVTYPSPYRNIEIANGKIHVDTVTVDEINFNTNGKEFPEYAREFLEKGMETLVPSTLAQMIRQQQPNLTEEQALQYAQALVDTQLAPQLDPSITVGSLITDALIQHYVGDETLSPQNQQILQGMTSSDDPMVKMLGNAILSLLNDPSQDNSFVIDLNSLNKEM